MDRNLRLLWAYDHPTTRYQEVNLYVDAGMEVVVSLGALPLARFDPEYHNETHALYPDWRSSLTLPASVVERLRRVPLTQHGGALDPESAALINRYIDVLIVPADAAVVARIMSWYGGYLLYRVMGAPNARGMLENLAEVEKIAAGSGGRLWLAPGLQNVMPFSSPTLREQFVYLNGWVSPERLHFSWKGRQSAPQACTAISYIDFHPFFADQFDQIREALRETPFIVVGKNDKRAEKCADARILGGLSTEALHHAIADSRVFVDAGTVPEHLIWPPLEAMAMGVPAFFTRWSGLAAAAMDEGHSESALREAGMCEDFAAIDAFLAKHLHDFDRLQEIAARQRVMFLEECFSREKALRNMRAFLEIVKSRRTRPIEAVTPQALAIAAEQCRRTGPEAQPHGSVALLDGDEAARLQRLLRPTEVRGDVGRMQAAANGHYVRTCVEGEDGPGFMVVDTLPSLKPGVYRLRAALEVRQGRGELARLGVIGAAGAEDGVAVTATRPGYLEVELPFEITRATVNAPREVRLGWHGKGVLSLLWLRLACGPARPR